MSSTSKAAGHASLTPGSSLPGVSRVRPYVPFIVALGTVCTLSVLFNLLVDRDGLRSVDMLMNSFMGFFYIVFALPKLFNLTGFKTAFMAYDIVAQRLPAYAYAYPFIELGLGLTLLVNAMRQPILTTMLTVLIIMISTIGIIGVGRALRNNKRLECACLGAKFSFPLSIVAILENASMLVMAVAMLLAPALLPSSHQMADDGIMPAMSSNSLKMDR